MNSKKKLIISLSVTIAVLLIAVVTIISVSAALNQNISSKVKVSFKPSQHVIGYVSAEYTFGGVTHDMTTNGEDSGNKRISFAYRENETVKTLRMLNSDLENGVLKMPNDAESIMFRFLFRNTGVSDYAVELDASGITKKENVKISYSSDKIVWKTEIPEVIVESPIYADTIWKSCYVKVQVENTAYDASFEGAFLWNLIAMEDR